MQMSVFMKGLKEFHQNYLKALPTRIQQLIPSH